MAQIPSVGTVLEVFIYEGGARPYAAGRLFLSPMEGLRMCRRFCPDS